MAYRHTIVYFASDEASRRSPFTFFEKGRYLEYGRRIQDLRQIGEETYEITFYNELTGEEVMRDFAAEDIKILCKKINQTIEFEDEDLAQFLYLEDDKSHAAE